MVMALLVIASIVAASILTFSLPAAAAQAEPESLPEGFLEFLAAMVDQDGELVDPLSLDTEPFPGVEADSQDPAIRDASEATEVRDD